MIYEWRSYRFAPGQATAYLAAFQAEGLPLVARHMPKYIPGNPIIVTHNMPGGGSLLVADYADNLRRLRQLEEENRKLKQLVADLGLDKVMLQDVLSKKL